MSSTLREVRLADAFLALSQDLDDRQDCVGLLQRLADHTVDLLDLDAATVLAQGQGPAGDHSLHTAASAADPAGAEAVGRLARIQLDKGQGPGHDVLRSGTRLAETPLSRPVHRIRWPHFTGQALACGFTTLAVIPLRRADRTQGAVALFHRRAGTLTPAVLDLGQSLAEAAAITLRHRSALAEQQARIGQLHNALDSRIVIEQAKGILAERHHCSPDDAFALLRGHARSHQLRLAELAERIINEPAGPEPGQ
ncbi:ANTAR domain-containing protein [Streptomyces sp. RKAG337]|uniref:ANTAR domain-containing protein n=1 Tax=Streptomyces sp. RKAG337 TaxID=2893404 RepID=UPI002033BC65|nr:GAF and ANTAR domain-containing protein [Streptomyces sp. RKAG337]MCM2424676.1 GAF and ANTAR domain-containing protein [Streptomyces sp. RKAG337]